MNLTVDMINEGLSYIEVMKIQILRRDQWGGCEHCGTRQVCITLLLNERRSRLLFATLLLQHPVTAISKPPQVCDAW